MPTFKFEAMSTTGEEVKDSVEATSEDEAQQKIRQMGYFVTRIQQSAGGTKKGGTKTRKKEKTQRKKTFTIRKSVSSKQLCQFTRQFSTLQDAGLPVLRSLRILERQLKPGNLKNALLDVTDDVEGGATLSEAFARHPKCFDRLYVNMIKAGEAGGALEVIMQRLAEFKEKAQELKRKILGAMVYPAVVISVAVSILGFILYYIIPKFQKIFLDFDITLPAVTQLLLTISDYVQNYFWAGPLFLIGFFLFVKLIKLTRKGAYAVDWVKLHIPVLGGILEKTVVARTTRTLGTLLASGVPILEALSIVKETAGNGVYERMWVNVYESIREGETIARPLKESKLVDDIVVNMVDVGEETGDLDRMLNKVADVYEAEVDVLVASLVSLLEPLMIVFLGFCVGFIVIALFMPMLAILEKLSAGSS